MTITEQTGRELITLLKETNRLLKQHNTKASSKKEPWVRAAQLPLYTKWKNRIDWERARRNDWVETKNTNEDGMVPDYLYNLNSIDEKFLVK